MSTERTKRMKEEKNRRGEKRGVGKNVGEWERLREVGGREEKMNEEKKNKPFILYDAIISSYSRRCFSSSSISFGGRNLSLKTEK